MKRDAFIRELRETARKRGNSFDVFTGKGKGSHYRVTFDGRISTVQSGELTPLMMRTIKKQLGIEER